MPLLSTNEILKGPTQLRIPPKPKLRTPPKVKAALMRVMEYHIELQHEGVWADSRRNLLTKRAQPLK